MNYYLDQEFIEAFRRPFLGKRRHFIDLISIGIVADDGREYYAVCSEYDYEKASPWVVDNVIRPIYEKEATFAQQYDDFANPVFLPLFDFHRWVGKSRKQIAQEVIDFMSVGQESPVIYGYYADYDWVLFCSLFGTMNDLPKGFPQYCRDLKQPEDEIAAKISKIEGGTVNDALKKMQRHVAYPKQVNEHNALFDARFNRDLHKFLQKM